MKENETAVIDQRMVSYSRALENALELEKDIKRKMQEGEKTVYRTICEKTGEEIKVINPDGKAIADGIIKDISRQYTTRL